MPPKFGGAPQCAVCAKSVYAAEQVLAVNAVFHKACFKCSSCNTWLDSSTCCDKGGILFCKACYAKAYGPKGYGFAGGGAMMHTESRASPEGGASAASPAGVNTGSAPAPPLPKATAEPAAPPPARAAPRFGGAPSCPTCGKSVYAAEQVLAAGAAYHKACFKCSSCSKWLDSSTACDRSNTLYCKSCYAKDHGPKGFGFGNATHTQ
ncbi:hypothetical protein AB1Y20_017640 [Prymnesium parvum]|uniref:LIM zinc-binding domain-containing protein n=1 Tax=Prymnesium parvum TaxID=97485 RepID=A0AB34JP00_PRYPA